MSLNPTERFSRRAPYYHQSRPRYPRALVDLLAAEIALTPGSIIADVGAGTGISSEPFLDYGCTVYAVEPNAAMLAIAQAAYGGRPNLHLIAASAEATTLPAHSVDLVTAGQAFHWFDHAAARLEFDRIRKPGGRICLFWNTRKDNAGDGGFLAGYNALVARYDIDGGEQLVKGTAANEAQQLTAFFGPVGYEQRALPNAQPLDWDHFQARLLSASYLPLPGDPGYDPMMAEAHTLFEAHQREGRVTLHYVTEVYWSR
jgi:SAM-dependent methyltransferase